MSLSRATLEPEVEALLEPVRPLLEEAVSRLPTAPPPRIALGEVSGFYRLEGRVLTLSKELAGPAIHHPGEDTSVIPPMDRWRRAAGCVLEGMALLGLARRFRVTPRPDWRWHGAALAMADHAAPELGLSQPDVAAGIQQANLCRFPRAGVLVYLHGLTHGVTFLERAGFLLPGGMVSVQEWSEIGQWVFAPDGAGSALPVMVSPRPAEPPPAALGAWSWRTVQVAANPTGGRLVLEGEGFIGQPWVAAGETHRVLVACADAPGVATLESGGPVGRWELASAQGFGQVFGARGVQFEFGRDGSLLVVLADAFVGPLAALAMAEEVGTSGVANARWRVTGRSQLAFAGIAAYSMTLHDRAGEGFMMPAGGFGLAEWLRALEDGPWAWQETEDRLVMRGRMMGGAVEIRFKKA